MAVRTLFGVEAYSFTTFRADPGGDLEFIIVFGYPPPGTPIEIPYLFPLQSLQLQDSILSAVFQFNCR